MHGHGLNWNSALLQPSRSRGAAGRYGCTYCTPIHLQRARPTHGYRHAWLHIVLCMRDSPTGGVGVHAARRSARERWGYRWVCGHAWLHTNPQATKLQAGRCARCKPLRTRERWWCRLVCGPACPHINPQVTVATKLWAGQRARCVLLRTREQRRCRRVRVHMLAVEGSAGELRLQAEVGRHITPFAACTAAKGDRARGSGALMTCSPCLGLALK